MSKKRSFKISTLSSRISTVVSVALVLLIVGMIMIITTLTSDASDALRQRVGIVVSVDPQAPKDLVSNLEKYIAAQPYTSTYKYTTADEVFLEEMQYNADILQVLDDNPYSAEFEIFLKPQYVNSDSINAISRTLEVRQGVQEVYAQSELVENVNDVLKKISLILTAVGIILLVISAVLLFNTVSLTIYSRRFVIRTMQLVGATSAFVRRPFVVSGVYMGITSALIASVIICMLRMYAESVGIEALFFCSWGHTIVVCASLFVIGVLFCGAASYMATNRFLNASTDTLYRR